MLVFPSMQAAELRRYANASCGEGKYEVLADIMSRNTILDRALEEALDSLGG
ncbi:MAG: hypothetical protein ACRD19_13995 [Terriglobia bacterium]